MRLSETDRDILKCVFHRAGLSVEELSQFVPYKPHVIRRSIERLRSEGVIRKSIFCNPFKLGFSMQNMHFSLVSSPPERIAAILRRVTEHPLINWCGAMASSPDYELTFMSRSRRGLVEFMEQLCNEFGDVFAAKSLGIEVSHHYFGYRFISKREIAIPEVSFREGEALVSIDRIDAELMRTLSSDPESSLTTLARKLGVPATTLSYRKKKLREAGVLLEEVYFLNLNVIAPIGFNIMASVSNVSDVYQEMVLRFCRSSDNIFFCHRCLGDWDFKFGVIAETRQEALVTIEEIRGMLGKSLVNFRVAAIMQKFKDDFFPFDAALVADPAATWREGHALERVAAN